MVKTVSLSLSLSSSLYMCWLLSISLRCIFSFCSSLGLFLSCVMYSALLCSWVFSFLFSLYINVDVSIPSWLFIYLYIAEAFRVKKTEKCDTNISQPNSVHYTISRKDINKISLIIIVVVPDIIIFQN